MIVPSGSPPWARVAAMQDYGGHVDKIDYGNIGAVNSRTDVTAAQICRLAADAAAVSTMIPLFILDLLTVAGSPGTFTVERIRSQWGGVRDTPYAGAAPPSGCIGVTNVSGVGSYPTGPGGYVALLAVPSSATELFGVTAAIVVRSAVSAAASPWGAPSNASVFVLPGGAATRCTIVGY
jgi:hypothetical protein